LLACSAGPPVQDIVQPPLLSFAYQTTGTTSSTTTRQARLNHSALERDVALARTTDATTALTDTHHRLDFLRGRVVEGVLKAGLAKAALAGETARMAELRLRLQSAEELAASLRRQAAALQVEVEDGVAREAALRQQVAEAAACQAALQVEVEDGVARQAALRQQVTDGATREAALSGRLSIMEGEAGDLSTRAADADQRVRDMAQQVADAAARVASMESSVKAAKVRGVPCRSDDRAGPCGGACAPHHPTIAHHADRRRLTPTPQPPRSRTRTRARRWRQQRRA